MAEITILGDDFDGEGERGERGKRGARGRRGHQGPTGPAGSTGPTGPSTGALLGRQVFDVAGSGTYTPTPGTLKAIVRGTGGGGGGDGGGATDGSTVTCASGGNSGVAIEIEILVPLGMTGGPLTVGAGGSGGVGFSLGATGGASTLLIGGVTLTAPGGNGGSFNASITPTLSAPTAQSTFAVGVDYQACTQGEPGIAVALLSTAAIMGGTGGSGDYGIGGVGGTNGSNNGKVAHGNGGGGGGASAPPNSLASTGGAGTAGLWIVEEYS